MPNEIVVLAFTKMFNGQYCFQKYGRMKLKPLNVSGKKNSFKGFVSRVLLFRTHI